jgi:hypothetical protein
VPDALIEAGRLHPDEDVVVSGHRLVDVPELEDLE